MGIKRKETVVGRFDEHSLQVHSLKIPQKKAFSTVHCYRVYSAASLARNLDSETVKSKGPRSKRECLSKVCLQME